MLHEGDKRRSETNVGSSVQYKSRTTLKIQNGNLPPPSKCGTRQWRGQQTNRHDGKQHRARQALAGTVGIHIPKCKHHRFPGRIRSRGGQAQEGKVNDLRARTGERDAHHTGTGPTCNQIMIKPMS